MVVKLGVNFLECVDLVKYLKEECLNLRFLGLMIIGMFGYLFIVEFFKVVVCLYLKNIW